jgi:predicted Zn-dependent protease
MQNAKNSFRIATVFIGLVFVFLGGCATGGIKTAWKAEDVAKLPNPNINLNRPDNTTAKMVQRSSIQELVETTSQIQKAAGVTVELYLVEMRTSDPNAFAWTKDQRSYVAITLPMLDLLGRDKDAYAFLLGHEIGHIVTNHSAANQTRHNVIGVLKVITAVGLAVVGVPGGGSIADLGGNLVETSYTRDQEREADTLGLQYMTSAGYDPQGAIRMFEKLREASGSTLLPFLNSHPTSKERISNMQAIIQANTMQAKVKQTTPIQSAANCMAPTLQCASVAARVQLEQDRSRAAANESVVPSGSSNVQLAMSFEDGVNAYGQKDYTKAMSIFRGLADKGNGRAQTYLGLMYQLGLGVAKDDTEAVKWYRKAADQNFATAQFNLGYMYSNGRGFVKDDVEAVKWYRKAADRGHSAAQFNLGRKYELGEGIAKDHGEAVKWFREAADQGYAPAQETLRKLGVQ